jgi:hypothetical protein
MSRARPQRLRLCAHPQGESAAVQGIAVDLELTPGGMLRCRYDLRADLSRLRLPSGGAGRRADELWRHTCFEAFLAAAGARAYYELNFSPALDWALYHFGDYRTGMTAPPLAVAPELSVRARAGGLELRASLALDSLPLLAPARALRIALAAVVEDAEGRLGYWALRHPPGNADFHDPQSFTLELSRT